MSTTAFMLRIWMSTHKVDPEIAEVLKIAADELDQLESYAECYRWLREQTWDTGLLAVVANPKAAIKLGHYAPSHELLDDAVRTAMAADHALKALQTNYH